MKKPEPLWWMNPNDYGYNEMSSNKGQDKSPTANDSFKVVIFNASIALLVKERETLHSTFESIAKKYSGYVQTLGTNRSVIRVESQHLSTALDDISQLGEIANKEVTGEDVTENYWNFKIRLDNAKKAREAYLGLLKRAENVEAALKVEKELERLNGEIDLLEGKMGKLKHLAKYSTIRIDIRLKPKPGILGYVGLGIYKGVKWLFVR